MITRLTIEVDKRLKKAFKKKAESEGYKMKGKLVLMMKEYVGAEELASKVLEK